MPLFKFLFGITLHISLLYVLAAVIIFLSFCQSKLDFYFSPGVEVDFKRNERLTFFPEFSIELSYFQTVKQKFSFA